MRDGEARCGGPKCGVLEAFPVHWHGYRHRPREDEQIERQKS